MEETTGGSPDGIRLPNIPVSAKVTGLTLPSSPLFPDDPGATERKKVCPEVLGLWEPSAGSRPGMNENGIGGDENEL